LIDVESKRLNTGRDGDGGVAHAGVHLARAAGEQLMCECQADAAIGTGDEDGGVFNLHWNFQITGKNSAAWLSGNTGTDKLT